MLLRWDVVQRFLVEEAGDGELDEILNHTLYRLTASMEEKDDAFMLLLNGEQLCRSPQVMRRFHPGLQDLRTGADGNTNEGNTAVSVFVLPSG